MKTQSKIGRPKLPKGEAKSLMVRARVSTAEQRLIEDAAKATGKEISEWIRSTLLAATEHVQRA